MESDRDVERQQLAARIAAARQGVRDMGHIEAARLLDQAVIALYADQDDCGDRE